MIKKTILIVDDTFENLYLLRVILEEAGYHVIEATNGCEGLKKLRENNPVDLIISDILMPVMDGFLFCQACKKEELFKNIPFVFYTSTYTEKLDEDFALKLGAVQFLRKPIDHDEVILTVKNIFGKESKPFKHVEQETITNEGVLKLYSERLINKLEQKGLDLEKEIEERKKAEIEIKAAKDFSENLILNLQEGLSVVSLGGVQLEANPALCKMIGFEREELIGKKEPFNYWPPEEYSKIRNAFSRTIEGEGNSFQLTLMRKSGERFPVMVSIASVKNNKGAIIANFATLRDISEKIKTQELLESIAEKSTERKNIIIELASYVGKDFNTALKKITMLSAKALDTEQASILEFHNNNTKLISRQFYNARNNVFEEGGTYYEKEYPEYFKIIQESISLNIQDAVNNSITKKLARVDFIPKGITSILDLPIQGIDSLYGVLCFDHIGDKRIFTTEEENFARSIAHLISLMVIDHQRKIAEQNLKMAQDFSKEIVLSLKDGLGIVNIKGELIEVNPEFCKMTGFSEKELIGSRAPFPYWPPEEIENIIKILSSTIDGNSEKVELNFMRKNGERFPVSISTSSIKNKQGAIVALFGIIEDITKQKNEQKLLEYSAKKSNLRKNAIIDLASLVGQDFNESLNKITSLSAKTLNVERVSVWKLNEDKTENYCRKLYKLKSDSFSSGLILKREDHPKYFKELEEKSIVSVNNAVNNVLTKTLAKDYLLPNNITSKMSIAVNGLDGLYGIICFEHVGKQRDWESDEEEFAISVANIVSVTIESAERKYAEGKIAMANIQLLEANKELNILRKQLEQENVYLRNEIDLVFNYEEMVYGSAAFSEVLTNVEKVAPTNATVLLLGESGTGKELLARAVHNISLRNKKPLIKVNCSAIPRELMESELFGHKKGSFTGAFNDKVGKFELANGGTLFLDEIGELPLDMQPKILRFLQEGEIEVVGGTGLKKLDVRVIAATNRNLKEEIEKKHFREDLYFRLNVFPIEIPPLRKRKEDIPLLVEHFIDKFNKAYAKNTKYIPDDSMNQLKSYSWPGNIRELENLIERASILSTSETLIIPGFESKTQKTKLPVKSNSLSLDLVQRNYILQILEQCNWKISGPNGAAVKLDLKPSTLRDKMAKLHITKPH